MGCTLPLTAQLTDTQLNELRKLSDELLIEELVDLARLVVLLLRL